MASIIHDTSAGGGTLSATQHVILIAYGAALWFLAAMLVRILAPMGALDGDALVLTYALVVPGTVPAVFLTNKLAGLARHQSGTGIAIVTATALLLDGTAFGWFPALYATDLALALKGAAVILWGGGVGLVLGLVIGGTGRR